MCFPLDTGVQYLPVDKDTPMTNTRNIVLVGPMGSGKTTVGKTLAKALGRSFVDTDQCIEDALEVSISWIFDQEGEEKFRLRETKILKEQLERSGLVIATGGGIVTVEENRRMLAESDCLIVYLRPELTILHQRLSRSKKRPLIDNAEDKQQQIEQLFEQRDPLYTQVADITHNSGSASINKQTQQLSETIQQCLNTAT